MVSFSDTAVTLPVEVMETAMEASPVVVLLTLFAIVMTRVTRGVLAATVVAALMLGLAVETAALVAAVVIFVAFCPF